MLENLTIALEPEAVSIYCQFMKFFKEDASCPAFDVLKSGTKYMVVDLGGTSSEITLHQMCENNSFEAVLPTTRGPWGGKTVDDEFFKFLSELVGHNVWHEFKTNHNNDHLEIAKYFERKKRIINPENLSGKTQLLIPSVLVDLSIRSQGVTSFIEVIQNNDLHRNHVDYSANNLVFSNTFFSGFFRKTINGIIKLMDEYIQTSEAKNVECIVIVGGFSQCLLLQDAINKHFRNMSIIIPDKADLAVMHGAVLYCHACS